MLICLHERKENRKYITNHILWLTIAEMNLTHKRWNINMSRCISVQANTKSQDKHQDRE